MKALFAFAAMEELPDNALTYLTGYKIKGMKEADQSKVADGTPVIKFTPDGGAQISRSTEPGDKILTFPNGFLGNDMIGTRLLSGKLAQWFPATHLRWQFGTLTGGTTHTRHGRNWQIDAGGFSLAFGLGFEGVATRWWGRRIALLYGLEAGFNYRNTSYLEVDDSRGVKVNHTSSNFSGTLKLGLNGWDWVSVYGVLEGRVPTYGVSTGVGVEVTGLGPFRIGCRALYDLYSKDGVNTGIPGANPADFAGWSLLPYIELVL
jgi:hypothetical protein